MQPSASSRALTLVFLSLGLASCGTSAPQTMSLVAPPYTLDPGQEEYLCFAYTIPVSQGETAITAFRPDYGASTHHIFFGYTLNPEPEGLSDCPVLSKTTWVPLFLGGTETSDLELPANTAFTLPPGTQIFMQLHLQNPTAERITAQTSMHLDLTTPSPDLIPAGLFGLDDRTVVIPPRSPSTETTMGCVPGRELHVFAVLGHMHTYGSRLQLFRGGLDGEMLFDQIWNFADQPTTPADFVVGASDMVTLRCEHQNMTDVEVRYGESSTTEMCSAVMYYSPAETTVDGCIEGEE